LKPTFHRPIASLSSGLVIAVIVVLCWSQW